MKSLINGGKKLNLDKRSIIFNFVHPLIGFSLGGWIYFLQNKMKIDQLLIFIPACIILWFSYIFLSIKIFPIIKQKLRKFKWLQF
jgi:hypothetical protein